MLSAYSLQVKCRRQSKAPTKDTNETSGSEEMWKGKNAKLASVEGDQEETSYFDPSYDYMTTE